MVGAAIRIIAKLLVAIVWANLLSSAAYARPNFVVIMTDDQEDTGSMAFMPKTLSLVAEHGVTFSNSFVNFPICAPSRASFFPGQAAHNHRITANKTALTSLKKYEENVLPVWLQAAGYTTALLGKYINGYGKRDNAIWSGLISSWIGLGALPPQICFETSERQPPVP